MSIPTEIKIPSVTPSLTLKPTFTSTPEPTPTLLPTLVPLAGICSPLDGIDLDELHLITTQSFSYPSAFSDLGHPAVDLGFYQFQDLSTMHGLPVESILPGQVVQVIDNRFPYGNMILIETRVDLLSPVLLKSIPEPTPIPAKNIELWNTCNKEMNPISWSEDAKSIYILYSHLESKPDFHIGDRISCGQTIGAVGITGNSVADHLHIEMRFGPSDARFGTISSLYEDATPEERYNYCIWSKSGIFQAADPAIFWNDQP